MALTKLPSHADLVDTQYVQVQGPDELISGFQYDMQTRALYGRDSLAASTNLHGITHISEDLIPEATCDTSGLMAADDKCKIDALLQTRIGILGFQGAGFPDDGGWMQGDIMLAAGSEFISLERVGNVVRFTVDSPIPLNCSCEACAQIFWVQDETEVSAIRPPSCAGKLPGVDGYGELKFYLMPESLIIDPANPAASLGLKGQYPSMIFKRYDDAVTPGYAEYELTLRRDPNNQTETSIGWVMTPGAGFVPECIWFMGEDTDGNRIRFELDVETEPGMLGGLLFKGHLLTKKMAVVTDYTAQILQTNQYICKWWDIQNAAIASDEEITATNVWQYSSPEGLGVNQQELVLDRIDGILEVGTLVDMWFFQVGEVGGSPIRRYFFSKQPPTLVRNIWSQVGGVEFGSLLEKRVEDAGTGSGRFDAEEVSDHRNFERTIWGLTGWDNPVMMFDSGTAGLIEDLHDQHRARIDVTVPGLVVEGDLSNLAGTTPYIQRPVHLWNRHRQNNVLATLAMGAPIEAGMEVYPPYDVLLNAPIDSFDNVYLKVIDSGEFADSGHYILVKGAHFRDLPQRGRIRLLTGDTNYTWAYTNKMLFPASDDDAIALVSTTPFVGSTGGDTAELLHEDYSSPCVRFEFSSEPGLALVMQIKVGTLSMDREYEEDNSLTLNDDAVRGLEPGYTVSSIYTQDVRWDGVSASAPNVNVDGFIIYDGGYPQSATDPTAQEIWNEVEIMQRDDQVWLWWNGLLIPPNTSLSSALETPVAVNTPYFPIETPSPMGKFGMRLFPGAILRRIMLRTQNRSYSEYTRGQLELA